MNIVKRTVAAAFAAVVLSAFAAPAYASGLPACEYEDGSGNFTGEACRWDASAEGNGTGDSFTAWPVYSTDSEVGGVMTQIGVVYRYDNGDVERVVFPTCDTTTCTDDCTPDTFDASR